MDGTGLAGRVAVVTGGAQGIGLAVAERLTKAGARVAIWDMDGDLAERSATVLNGRAFAVDVADTAAVARTAAATEAAMGPVGVLVTSADRLKLVAATLA
ncbi:MAG: SDR family NAD(P)-dependent oxidoreductase, partial [Pseudomonadota bacterium]